MDAKVGVRVKVVVPARQLATSDGGRFCALFSGLGHGCLVRCARPRTLVQLGKYPVLIGKERTGLARPRLSPARGALWVQCVYSYFYLLDKCIGHPSRSALVHATKEMGHLYIIHNVAGVSALGRGLGQTASQRSDIHFRIRMGTNPDQG